MPEQPSKNLEYSRYDDEIEKVKKMRQKLEERIDRMQRDIEKFGSKIEEIKSDSAYSKEEIIKEVTHYERMINVVTKMIEITRANIGLTQLLEGVSQIAKEQADELLKQGESLDSLTADIENEDKPSRRIN